MDQFEMHLRAVLCLPCPPPRMRVARALMVNIIGQGTEENTMGLAIKALSVSGAAIHWYGKSECRQGRKMAHITLTASCDRDLVLKADELGVDR
jgi:phosphoribosylaminoimidazole carboxylase